ncbi:hypothetical protein EDC01DRAFT_636132 [Geopyxis carbonaria]|nr:hypothetical protein EDC01DRAFT_636132 [Geopyxis carbonaria]
MYRPVPPGFERRTIQLKVYGEEDAETGFMLIERKAPVEDPVETGSDGIGGSVQTPNPENTLPTTPSNIPPTTPSNSIPNDGEEILATRRQPRGAAIRAQEATRKIIAPIPLKNNRVTPAKPEKCVVRTGATTFAMFRRSEEINPPAQWAERYEEYHPAKREPEPEPEFESRPVPNPELDPENQYDADPVEAVQKESIGAPEETFKTNAPKRKRRATDTYNPETRRRRDRERRKKKQAEKEAALINDDQTETVRGESLEGGSPSEQLLKEASKEDFVASREEITHEVGDPLSEKLDTGFDDDILKDAEFHLSGVVNSDFDKVLDDADTNLRGIGTDVVDFPATSSRASSTGYRLTFGGGDRDEEYRPNLNTDQDDASSCSLSVHEDGLDVAPVRDSAIVSERSVPVQASLPIREKHPDTIVVRAPSNPTTQAAGTPLLSTGPLPATESNLSTSGINNSQGALAGNEGTPIINQAVQELSAQSLEIKPPDFYRHAKLGRNKRLSLSKDVSHDDTRDGSSQILPKKSASHIKPVNQDHTKRVSSSRSASPPSKVAGTAPSDPETILTAAERKSHAAIDLAKDPKTNQTSHNKNLRNTSSRIQPSSFVQRETSTINTLGDRYEDITEYYDEIQNTIPISIIWEPNRDRESDKEEDSENVVDDQLPSVISVLEGLEDTRGVSIQNNATQEDVVEEGYVDVTANEATAEHNHEVAMNDEGQQGAALTEEPVSIDQKELEEVVVESRQDTSMVDREATESIVRDEPRVSIEDPELLAEDTRDVSMENDAQQEETLVEDIGNAPKDNHSIEEEAVVQDMCEVGVANGEQGRIDEDTVNEPATKEGPETLHKQDVVQEEVDNSERAGEGDADQLISSEAKDDPILVASHIDTIVPPADFADIEAAALLSSIGQSEFRVVQTVVNAVTPPHEIAIPVNSLEIGKLPQSPTSTTAVATNVSPFPRISDNVNATKTDLDPVCPVCNVNMDELVQNWHILNKEAAQKGRFNKVLSRQKIMEHHVYDCLERPNGNKLSLFDSESELEPEEDEGEETDDDTPSPKAMAASYIPNLKSLREMLNLAAKSYNEKGKLDDRYYRKLLCLPHNTPYHLMNEMKDSSRPMPERLASAEALTFYLYTLQGEERTLTRIIQKADEEKANRSSTPFSKSINNYLSSRRVNAKRNLRNPQTQPDPKWSESNRAILHGTGAAQTAEDGRGKTRRQTAQRMPRLMPGYEAAGDLPPPPVTRSKRKPGGEFTPATTPAPTTAAQANGGGTSVEAGPPRRGPGRPKKVVTMAALAAVPTASNAARVTRGSVASVEEAGGLPRPLLTLKVASAHLQEVRAGAASDGAVDYDGVLPRKRPKVDIPLEPIKRKRGRPTKAEKEAREKLAAASAALAATPPSPPRLALPRLPSQSSPEPSQTSASVQSTSPQFSMALGPNFPTTAEQEFQAAAQMDLGKRKRRESGTAASEGFPQTAEVAATKKRRRSSGDVAV